MKFVAVRDFRTKPKDVWKELSDENTMTITLNGKPVAIMLSTDPENYERSLDIIRRVKAEQAVMSIQEQSAKSGLNKLTDKEIDAEIKAARESR
ncbi:MAG TPA: type II toxin-antitoxin system Phd/YefM family antitoxin [Clostridiales bacterium]|nr:type II toxin-antitoxin system Phd/YefM family antitoxin [Clostridiales bacterium]HQP69206.1 type II toxin-antitoxin system Phd/YefM family antitoxin [Clostridiales bacterium]